MLGLSLGHAPNTGNSALRAVTSLIRVVISAFFAAAGATLLMIPNSPAILGGFTPVELAPVLGFALIAAGCALALRILLSPVRLVLTAYLVAMCCIHLGLGGAFVQPEAFWADVALIALVHLCSVDARRAGPRDTGFRPDPKLPHAPSGPRKATHSTGYLQALRDAAARWDRAA